jgi:hypothetical protein
VRLISPIRSRLDGVQFDRYEGSCGEYILFRATRDKHKSIRIEIDAAKVGLEDGKRVFDPSKDVSAKVILVGFGQQTFEFAEGYCTDAATAPDSARVSVASVQGRLQLNVRKDRASALRSELEFIGSSGTKFKVPDVSIENVRDG